MNTLTKLENRLKELYPTQKNFIVDPKNINSKNINKYRNILRTNGILVLKNAISEQSVIKSISNIGKDMVNMYTSEGYGPIEIEKDSVEILQNASSIGDLHEFNSFRNSNCPWGNLSFSFMYKMQTQKENYLQYELEDGNIAYFDYLPTYLSILDILADDDNDKTTAIHFALTHPQGGQISWDSVKVGTEPRNSAERKAMTGQKPTEMHMDIYDESVERWQVIDNFDTGNIRLFFLVGGKDAKVQKYIKEIENFDDTKQGFIKINNIELQKVIKKYSVAPEPLDRVYWDSGVPHFESVCDSKNKYGMYVPSLEKLKSNKKCIRWVNGVNIIKNVTESDHKKIALTSLFGFCPAVYGKVNKKSDIYPNIVNSKSTMFKKNRQLTDKEREYFLQCQNIIESDTFEDVLMNKLAELNPKFSYMLGLKSCEEAGFKSTSLRIIRAVE